MKAKKVIWYKKETPKDKDGNYVKEAVFDKRIKKISLNDDLPEELVKQADVKKRLLENGSAVEETDAALMEAAEKQKDADKTMKKDPELPKGKNPAP